MNQLQLLSAEPLAVVERISQRARRLRIEVRPTGDVILVIPRRVSRREAHAFLQHHAGWIRRKLHEWRLRGPLAAAPMRPLCWDGTDTLPLRGVEVPLRLEPASTRRPFVRLGEHAIMIFAPADAGHAPLTRTLRAALQREARRVAEQLLKEEAARLGVQYTGLRIGDPRSLWGSCGRNGRISLSWRLLLAPADVFRYVVVHELCHRVYHSHGPRFWGLVERQLPDYQAPRRWLKERGASLHAHLPHRA